MTFIYIILMGALTTLSVIAINRAAFHARAAGYWQGRCDEHEVQMLMEGGADSWEAILKVRDQIIAELGEKEAASWVESIAVDVGAWPETQADD